MSWAVVIIAFIAGAVAVGIGDIFSKRWITTGSNIYLLYSSLGYIAQMSCWFFIFREVPQLAKMTIIWAVVMLLVGVLAGLILFREPFSIYNYIGFIFAISSIIFLSIK